MEAKVTERGQVSIPAQLRREMHLEPGSKLIFERVSKTECRLIVKAPAQIKPNPIAAIGFAKRHGLPVRRTSEWMKTLREAEKED